MEGKISGCREWSFISEVFMKSGVSRWPTDINAGSSRPCGLTSSPHFRGWQGVA